MVSHEYYDDRDLDGPQTFFHQERAIRQTRKEHTCHVCHWAIPAGSAARYFARRDSDTDDGRIDYGYECAWAGPCFDPSRAAERFASVEDIDEPPF